MSSLMHENELQEEACGLSTEKRPAGWPSLTGPSTWLTLSICRGRREDGGPVMCIFEIAAGLGSSKMTLKCSGLGGRQLS